MKVIVSDFDNTFFTNEIVDNVKLVDNFRKKGNLFIIATGRPIYLLKPDLIKHNVKYDYLICNDGAVIFDKEEKIIDKTNIDYHTTVQIYNILKRNTEIEHVYIDTIYDFGELDAKDFNGILALPYDRDRVNDFIKDICKNYPTIQGYFSHRWINILNISVSKGNAIKLLQEMYNWDSNDIYVIGDNKNDISMTTYENSYAVKNSKTEYINKCNYKVENFQEMLEKII